MSRVSTDDGDADMKKFGDSTELSPPMKKPKTDPKAEAVGQVEAKAEAEVEAEAEADVPPERPTFREIDRENPEYWSQREMFKQQYEKSEGYDLEWDKFDYKFAPIKFEWGYQFDPDYTNKELMEILIKTAIEEENEEYGTQLEFVEYVSANVTAVTGFCFFITLRAKDLSSSDPEPKLYRTKVRKFRDEIHVIEFKLRPTQE